jgi:general secretion pathway protein M
MWMQINQAWSQLAQREQRMLMALAVFLAASVLYLLVWAPIHTGWAAAQQTEQKARADWQWLSEQVAKHPPGQQTTLTATTQSQLMGSLQQSLREENLLGFMQGIAPSAQSVKVTFKEVPAPRLFRWLSRLEAQGLVSSQLQMTPIRTGVVEASIRFEVTH